MAQASSTAIVVGAGINGASTAFWLAEKGLGVTLLEQEHPASGPTGSSSATTHAFYLERELNVLGARGIEILQNMEDIAGGPSEYRRNGFLWVCGQDKTDLWRGVVERMRADGIKVDGLDPAAVQELAPSYDLSDVAYGVWEAEGGHADPVTTTTTLAKAVTRKGGKVRVNARVKELIHEKGRVAGVILENGENMYADVVVLAAGPWTRALVAALGLDLPTFIERHYMAVMDTPGRAREVMPWSWGDDINANYARPDGEDIVLLGYWSGGGTGVRHEDAERQMLTDPGQLKRNVSVDESASIVETFAKRIPEVVDLNVRRGYADLYDMSPDDQPLIGELPGIAGLFVICGSSGHGFKTGPAIGEAVAEVIVSGNKNQELLGIFDPARFFQ